MTDAVARALAALSEREDLSRDDARALFTAIMSGEATPAQIGGVLMALRVKGETVDEITGAAEAMRSLATRVPVQVDHLVDTCGTGGSGAAKLFNVSTAAAFVAAAAGAHVAKHGNRGMTSKSGSADVLEAAGVRIDLAPEQIARCVSEIGFGFMFAPAHHGAMKHAIGARRELAVRTIFNLLGPLTNPANAPNQVIGVADASRLPQLAEVLRALGSRHVMLVSSDGLDEISIAGESSIVELKGGAIREYRISPGEFGIERRPLDGLRADSPTASLALVEAALTDPGSAASDIVALNAAAAIYAAGVATSLANGVAMAQDAISAGLAKERLDELVRVTKLMIAAQ
jgi:anthranilate phosphoribosyltransferase